eukprot:scaffold6282_cov119-Isochrysis_galbana.AAC.13
MTWQCRSGLVDAQLAQGLLRRLVRADEHKGHAVARPRRRANEMQPAHAAVPPAWPQHRELVEAVRQAKDGAPAQPIGGAPPARRAHLLTHDVLGEALAALAALESREHPGARARHHLRLGRSQQVGRKGLVDRRHRHEHHQGVVEVERGGLERGAATNGGGGGSARHARTPAREVGGLKQACPGALGLWGKEDIVAPEERHRRGGETPGAPAKPGELAGRSIRVALAFLVQPRGLAHRRGLTVAVSRCALRC